MSDHDPREVLPTLTLPLAQLYSRARIAKEPRSQHDNCFYLLEAAIKLTAFGPIAWYLEQLTRDRPDITRDTTLDTHLKHLAVPSLGHWLAILRHASQTIATAQPTHPLGTLHRRLSQKHQHPDAPALLALYRNIKHGPDADPASDTSFTLLNLFDAVVRYRNAVMGHGGPRHTHFFNDRMVPLLMPAVDELLQPGMLDPLGEPDARLLDVQRLTPIFAQATVQESDDGSASASPPVEHYEVHAEELIGLEPARLPRFHLDADQADRLIDEHDIPGVTLFFSGHEPLRLDPLIRYYESSIGREVLLLNRQRRGHSVEYLSYTTGRLHTQQGPAADRLARWLHTAAPNQVSPPLEETSQKPTTPAVGRQLGDYELISRIGEGGMGVVYLARQRSLGRLVALKVLRSEYSGNTKMLARFQREMRVLGTCEHPHIVKLLDAGVFDDGCRYFTMEFVPGCDLEQVFQELARGFGGLRVSELGQKSLAHAVRTAVGKARESVQAKARTATPQANADASAAHGADPDCAPASLPVQRVPDLPDLPEVHLGRRGDDDFVRRIVELIRDAADALQTLHDRGIVHRDISPANLMLTPDGTRVVLMDFGLAKEAADTLELTAKGGFVGKLRYAAPEQFNAATQRVGPPADVRGLGVSLWELTTRRRLFAQARDEASLTNQVQHRDVPRLREVDPGFDRDLDAIVARACERDVKDRIDSAGRLRDYLQLYLDGLPLPIRPPGVGELAWRWAKAHRPIVATAAIALVLVCASVAAGFIGVTLQRNEARRNFEQARETVSTLFAALSDNAAFEDAAASAAQRDLLIPMIAQYRELLETYADEPQLRLEVAQANRHLARLFLRVGQPIKALDFIDQARVLLDALPQNAAHDAERARGLLVAAEAHLPLRQITAGKAAAREALRLLRQSAPTSETQLDLAQAYVALAELDRADLEYLSALDAYQLAEPVFRTHLQASPQDRRRLNQWAPVALGYTRMLTLAQRETLALPLALELIQALDTARSNAALPTQLTLVQAAAMREVATSRYPDAQTLDQTRLLLDALDLLTPLVKAPDALPEYHQEYLETLLALSRRFEPSITAATQPRDQQQAARTALAFLEQADQHVQRLTRIRPDDLTLQRLAARSMMRQAVIERGLSNFNAAAARHVQSVNAMQQLVEQHPGDPGLRYELVNVLWRYAYTLSASPPIPSGPSASTIYRQMSEHGETLLALKPSNIQAIAMVAQAYEERAKGLDPSDRDTKQALMRQASEWFGHVALREPVEPSGFMIEYVDSLANLAAFALADGDLATYRNYRQQCIALREVYIASYPQANQPDEASYFQAVLDDWDRRAAELRETPPA